MRSLPSSSHLEGRSRKTGIRAQGGSSRVEGRNYLDAGADGVHGQVREQAQHLGEGGDEEWEDEFPTLILHFLIDVLGNAFVPLIVDSDVYEGGDEGCREGELHPAVELAAVVLDGGEGEGDGVVVHILAGFEAGGDGVNGVEKDVAHPGSQRRDQSDLNLLRS